MIRILQTLCAKEGDFSPKNGWKLSCRGFSVDNVYSLNHIRNVPTVTGCFPLGGYTQPGCRRGVSFVGGIRD